MAKLTYNDKNINFERQCGIDWIDNNFIRTSH